MKERIQFFRDSLTGSPVFKHFVLVSEKKFGRKVDDTPRIKRKERKKKKREKEKAKPKEEHRSFEKKQRGSKSSCDTITCCGLCVCVCLCVYARVRCTKKCNIYKYTRNIDKMKNLHGLVGCFNF